MARRLLRPTLLLAILCLALAAPVRADDLTMSPPEALPGSLPGPDKFAGGEPSEEFDPSADGHFYAVAPGGDGSGPGVSFWRSADHGVTFAAPRAVGSSAGGGDADVEVGLDHTVYVADLEVVANAICRSHDFGVSFDSGCETGTATNQEGPESDREWINHDPRDPNLLYFTYHDITAEFPLVYRSTNGGSSFTPCGSLYQPGSDAFNNFGAGGTDVGKPAIASDGTMYVPITEPDGTGNPLSPYNHFDVAVAKGGCTGATVFEDHVIYTAPGAKLANIFSDIAVDGGGTAYALAAGTLTASQTTFGVYLFVSHDQGTTWSAPIRVNTPDLTANVLPALAGGLARDQVAVGWYGTSTSGDPNDTSDEWRYYVATSTDAGATFQQATVTPTPYHYGDVCTLGILCTGNRNLLDFSSIGVDPSDGTVVTVFPGDPFDTPANGATTGAAAYVSRQTSGALLASRGGTASGPRACGATAGFVSVAAKPHRGRLGLRFVRRVARPVGVDVFQTSHGRHVIHERAVARFSGRSSSFTWNGHATRRGRRVTDGYYFARYRLAYPGGPDIRRVTLRRIHGHFEVRPAFYRRATCGTIRAFKLGRPAFGGAGNHPLGVAFRLSVAGRAAITVLRGHRVVKRYPSARRIAHRTYRLRFGAGGRPRGDYRFRLSVTAAGGHTVTASLTSRRI